MWRNSRRKRVARDFGQRAGEFDAGRPAADDDEAQPGGAARRIGLGFGVLEREQQAAAQMQRIVERLQARRVRAQSS